MADPSFRQPEIARRIVEHEAGVSRDPVSLAAALETACSRLREQLVNLLGAAGVAALLRRSLQLAKREQPLLSDVAVSGEPGPCFTGLAGSLAASTDEEATAVTAAILAHLFDLLVMLLGDELGMKPVRKFWPQATRDREID